MVQGLWFGSPSQAVTDVREREWESDWEGERERERKGSFILICATSLHRALSPPTYCTISPYEELENIQMLTCPCWLWYLRQKGTAWDLQWHFTNWTRDISSDASWSTNMLSEQLISFSVFVYVRCSSKTAILLRFFSIITYLSQGFARTLWMCTPICLIMCLCMSDSVLNKIINAISFTSQLFFLHLKTLCRNNF